MSIYLLIDIIGPDQHDNREDNRHSEPALRLWDLVDEHSQEWLCHGSSRADSIRPNDKGLRAGAPRTESGCGDSRGSFVGLLGFGRPGSLKRWSILVAHRVQKQLQPAGHSDLVKNSV
jgi:hypothetical protein